MFNSIKAAKLAIQEKLKIRKITKKEVLESVSKKDCELIKDIPEKATTVAFWDKVYAIISTDTEDTEDTGDTGDYETDNVDLFSDAYFELFAPEASEEKSENVSSFEECIISQDKVEKIKQRDAENRQIEDFREITKDKKIKLGFIDMQTIDEDFVLIVNSVEIKDFSKKEIESLILYLFQNKYLDDRYQIEGKKPIKLEIKIEDAVKYFGKVRNNRKNSQKSIEEAGKIVKQGSPAMNENLGLDDIVKFPDSISKIELFLDSGKVLSFEKDKTKVKPERRPALRNGLENFYHTFEKIEVSYDLENDLFINKESYRGEFTHDNGDVLVVKWHSGILYVSKSFVNQDEPIVIKDYKIGHSICGEKQSYRWIIDNSKYYGIIKKALPHIYQKSTTSRSDSHWRNYWICSYQLPDHKFSVKGEKYEDLSLYISYKGSVELAAHIESRKNNETVNFLTDLSGYVQTGSGRFRLLNQHDVKVIKTFLNKWKRRYEWHKKNDSDKQIFRYSNQERKTVVKNFIKSIRYTIKDGILPEMDENAILSISNTLTDYIIKLYPFKEAKKIPAKYLKEDQHGLIELIRKKTNYKI